MDDYNVRALGVARDTATITFTIHARIGTITVLTVRSIVDRVLE